MFKILRQKKYLIIFTLLICTFIQILNVSLSKTVQAEPSTADWSWSLGNQTVFSSTAVSSPYSWCYGFFQNEEIEGRSEIQKVCMTSKGDIRFGVYFTGSAFIPVVGFPFDDKMYEVVGICGQYDNCLYLPGSDTLATKQYLVNGMVRSLVVYKNFIKRLTMVNDGFSKKFIFDKSNPNYIFQDEDGYAWPIGNFGASNDGNWLAIEFRQRGIGLLNIETLQMKRVSSIANGFSLGVDSLAEIAVSNSGNYISIMGMNVGMIFFSVDSDCGDDATDNNMEVNLPIYQPCKQTWIDTSSFIDRFYAAIKPRFTEDGGGLSFYAYSYGGGNDWREVSLRAAGYGGQKIDYLALGDSFTSGEGETDDIYYLKGTNDKNEKCHVSLRSYPYLLSDSMNIKPLDMASVACSGATTKDIAGSDILYSGQGDRLGKDKLNLNKSDQVIAKTQARVSFIPGRVHQETFVSEYSPKLITIGIGGNDAGLMEKLSACAGKDTCDWASSDESKQQTANEIKSLFGTLVKTYQSLVIASPSSKIYAIGYPRIIDQDGKCDVVTGFLFDETERKFMNESVAYLNQIVEAAAKSAGIKFINIQDIYGEYVLCGSKSPSAMNGARIGDDNQYNWLLNIGNESFHPNSLGHNYAAEAIINTIGNLMDYKYCNDGNITCPDSSVVAPEPSTYWIPDIKQSYPSQKKAEYLSDRHNASNNRQKQIHLDDVSLAPNSNVEIEITSETIKMGSFTASAGGSLSIDLDLPLDLPEGYHTMHLYGTTYSGELIELYQVFQYKKIIAKSTESIQVDNNTVIAVKTDKSIPLTDQNNVVSNPDQTSVYDGQTNPTVYLENPEVKGDYIKANNTPESDMTKIRDLSGNYSILYGFLGAVALFLISILAIKIVRARKTIT